MVRVASAIVLRVRAGAVGTLMRVLPGLLRRGGGSPFRDVIKTKARSFAFASRFLDPERRHATEVLYAFFRTVDDLVDERQAGDDPGTIAAQLEGWDGWLAAPTAERCADPLRAALAEVLLAYQIPPVYFRALLLALRDDLAGRPIATFEDLERYSFRVAATVGLAMCHVLGARSPSALAAAAALGIAMQLTNILRDLGDDVARGRVYLPADELARFGCSAEAFATGTVNERLRALLRFQIGRARRYYAAGAVSIRELCPEARYPIALAATLYGRILDKIEVQDYDVFSRRAAVGRPEKVALAGRVAVRLRLEHIGAPIPRPMPGQKCDPWSPLGAAARAELAACGVPGFVSDRFVTTAAEPAMPDLDPGGQACARCSAAARLCGMFDPTVNGWVGQVCARCSAGANPPRSWAGDESPRYRRLRIAT